MNIEEDSKMIGFWIFMFINSLIIPCTMIIIGKHYTCCLNNGKNIAIGYRTNMSMKNKDTRNFANNYCGKLCFKYGIISLLITTLLMIFVIGKDVDSIGIYGGAIVFIQTILLCIIAIQTETILKKTFDKNGNLRK